MATKVNFYRIWEHDNKTRIFQTLNNGFLWVSSFKDGIAVVEPSWGSDIDSFSSLVAGCFDDCSNFEIELCKAFDYDFETTLNGIQFEFNGVTILVTKENADKDKIVEEWRAGIDANEERYCLELEAYMKTPEYRAKRAKQLKIDRRRKTVEKKVISIDESTELEFKDEEAKANWEKWVEINSTDDYSKGVVTYACRWAKFMQHLMYKNNKPLYLIANEASNVSDIDGISGFMYGCAVSILVQCWKYGEELRIWHNKDYGYEGDGVVNPAVLTVSVG